MSDTITNYYSTEKQKCARDKNLNFDFGVEFDVSQQIVVTEHQVPEFKKFINLYTLKIVHSILTNNLEFFYKMIY